MENIADGAGCDDVASDAARIQREIGGDPNALPTFARLQIGGPHGTTGIARQEYPNLPTPETLGYADPDREYEVTAGLNRHECAVEGRRLGIFQPVLEHDAAARTGLLEYSGSRDKSVDHRQEQVAISGEIKL